MDFPGLMEDQPGRSIRIIFPGEVKKLGKATVKSLIFACRFFGLFRWLATRWGRMEFEGYPETKNRYNKLNKSALYTIAFVAGR